jgi:hypothetical protein
MSDRHEPPPTTEDGEATPITDAERSAALDDPSSLDRAGLCATFPDRIDDDPNPVSDIPY